MEHIRSLLDVVMRLSGHFISTSGASSDVVRVAKRVQALIEALSINLEFIAARVLIDNGSVERLTKALEYFSGGENYASTQETEEKIIQIKELVHHFDLLTQHASSFSEKSDSEIQGLLTALRGEFQSAKRGLEKNIGIQIGDEMRARTKELDVLREQVGLAVSETNLKVKEAEAALLQFGKIGAQIRKNASHQSALILAAGYARNSVFEWAQKLLWQGAVIVSLYVWIRAASNRVRLLSDGSAELVSDRLMRFILALDWQGVTLLVLQNSPFLFATWFCVYQVSAHGAVERQFKIRALELSLAEGFIADLPENDRFKARSKIIENLFRGESIASTGVKPSVRPGILSRLVDKRIKDS